MARHKENDYSQGKFIPIHFDKQIIPGTFEYSLYYLIDNEIDLSILDSRYQNDETGALAYDPAILLKIILYAYSKGITSSRDIAQRCRENIIFMALSADTSPHFTTIADFISTADQEIIKLFLQVLLVCDSMGLIGKEMIYNWRLGIAEPPFAHIKSVLRLDRFTLRGKRKVDAQWLLYCIVNNLTKIHRYGEEFA